MPIVEVQIERVTSDWRHTRHGLKQKFLVQPKGPVGQMPLLETWSAWHASLAKRAGETGRLVRFGLKDIPHYGQEIVTAELVEEARSHV